MIDLVVTFTASILIWLMFIGLIALWIFDGKFERELVIHAVIACVFAWVSTIFLKDVFNTTRPYVVDGARTLVFFIPNFENGAFPSSHAAASFALSLTVWFHDKRIGNFYIFSSILIGVARIIAHVHYPIDILGGAVVGIAIAIAVEKIHFIPSGKKIKQRG